MTALSLGLAFAIVYVPAWLWLQRLVPAPHPARQLLIAGYAVLLGMISITLVMRGLSAVGVDLSLTSIGGIALVLGIAALPVGDRWRTGPAAAPPPVATIGRWEKLLIALCLALLAGRLLLLGLELSTRPVFSWDTKQHWAKQAKVFFELRSTAPFVPYDRWLALSGQGVYTNIHPDYPITVPLLQTFTALALGEWREDLISVAWLLMWIAMGLVIYSQARLAGASAGTATAASFFVLSMPYLNIHVALAGYADLLLSACFLAACAALYNWSQRREAWLLALALLAGGACPLIKNEGFFWALCLLPGLVVVLLGPTRGVLLLALVASTAAALLWIAPDDLAVAGHTLAGLQLGYRPESWGPLLLSLFVHDNWHYTGWLFVAALIVTAAQPARLLPLATVLVAALTLYFALYVLTANAYGAVRYTSLNRVALHLVPSFGFFALVACLALRARLSPQS